eukprot:1143200-Pelagomonas_calceolata.AAC.4
MNDQSKSSFDRKVSYWSPPSPSNSRGLPCAICRGCTALHVCATRSIARPVHPELSGIKAHESMRSSPKHPSSACLTHEMTEC